MRSRSNITFRSIASSALLVIALLVFFAELSILAPGLLARPPYDYEDYVHWGIAERLGTDAYVSALPNYYPLPTTLWVFVPLSFVPSWFPLVWTVVPFLFMVWLFQKSGAVLWLYYPMLVQAAFGQLDGWLLLPLLWLIDDRPWFAGIGAVLMLFKPQLGFLTVLFALVSWVFKRDFRNLVAFATTLVIVYLPAFIVNPLWPLTMLDKMQVRANESNMLTRGATLWAWAWHGGITLWLLPIVAIIAIALVGYVFVVRGKRAQAVQLLGLMTVPVLYAANFVMIVPILKTPRQIVILTIASWIAVAIDTLAGGWGGAYVLIPLTALVLLARGTDSTINPPIPTSQTARSNTVAAAAQDRLSRD